MALEDTVRTITTCLPYCLCEGNSQSTRVECIKWIISVFTYILQSLLINEEYFLLIIASVQSDLSLWTSIIINKQFPDLIFSSSFFHSMHCQQARKLCYSWNQITLITANREAKQQWIRLNDPEFLFLYFIRKDETTLAQRYLSDILFNSIIIISFIIKKPEKPIFI